jgi:hypothetical protein
LVEPARGALDGIDQAMEWWSSEYVRGGDVAFSQQHPGTD